LNNFSRKSTLARRTLILFFAVEGLRTRRLTAAGRYSAGTECWNRTLFGRPS